MTDPNEYFPGADEAISTIGAPPLPLEDPGECPDEAQEELRPGFVLEYRPPPLDRLPPPFGPFISAVAQSLDCPPDLVLMPALAAAAAAIGDSREIRPREDWRELPILWTGSVAPSGSLKTPAMREALRGTRGLQDEAMQRWNLAKAQHERALVEWNSKGREGPEPKAPQPDRYELGDVTIEAIALRLRDNPRGVLIVRDELAGWFASMGRYTGSDEAAHWLSFHSGESLTVDRKTGADTVIYVPRAIASITGTIQASILRDHLADEAGRNFNNGLAARFLLSMPPERQRSWREEKIPPDLRRRYMDLFRDLSLLTPQVCPETGRRTPVPRAFTPEAKERFAEWSNGHQRELFQFKADPLKAAWSKIEASALRIALVFHEIRFAYIAGTEESEGRISLATLEEALAMTEWLKHEARRIYAYLVKAFDPAKADRLFAFARSRGGKVTARDAARNGAGGRNPADVETLMKSIVALGLARWEPRPPQATGGRPTRIFTVLEA